MTEEQARNFFRGKKLSGFADKKKVWELVKKPKYQPDIRRHLPNFVSDKQKDVEALRSFAEKLLGEVQGQVVLGAPPKIAPEIYDTEAYFERKQLKQFEKTHINLSRVEALIEQKKISKEASDVTAVLFISEAKQTLPSIEGSQTFAKPFQQTNPEIVSSSGDGEVKPLTQALEKCKTDLNTNRQSQAARNYELALVGPYGACDGCKDRLRAFKTEWRELAKQSAGVRNLTITYFYTNTKEPFRQGKTLYGWNEQLEGTTSEETPYYYRSLNATYTPG